MDYNGGKGVFTVTRGWQGDLVKLGLLSLHLHKNSATSKLVHTGTLHVKDRIF